MHRISGVSVEMGSRRWNSNIKATVALRLGLPLVAWPEAGYVETHPSAFWFTNILEMHRAIGKALATELENILRELIESRMAAQQSPPVETQPDRIKASEQEP